MGKINNTTKYPNDLDITGLETVIGSDIGGETVTFPLNSIAAFAVLFLGKIKDPSSSLYNGFIVIAGQNNTDTTIVEAGDILFGRNSGLYGGDLVILDALVDNPTDDSPGSNEFTVKFNLQ